MTGKKMIALLFVCLCAVLVIIIIQTPDIHKQKDINVSESEIFLLQPGDLVILNESTSGNQLYEIFGNATTTNRKINETISFYAFNTETYHRPGWYVRDRIKKVYKLGTEEYKEMAVKFITPWRR